MMLTNFFNKYNSINYKEKEIMHYGFEFSLILAAIGTFSFILYETKGSLFSYYIGFKLLQNSILFYCAFLALGLTFDRLENLIN